MEALLLLLLHEAEHARHLGVGINSSESGEVRDYFASVCGVAENMDDAQQRRAWQSILGGRSVELHMTQVKQRLDCAKAAYEMFSG